MDNVTLDINLLTEKEKKEYREANLKIAELETKIEFREMENRKKQNAQEITLTLKYKFEPPVWVCKLFNDTGLCKSLNEAKKLIKQKGLYINKTVVENIDYTVTKKDIIDGTILLQRGKKQFYRIQVK
ncbi:hypothetical protein KAR91_75210 [Candidatus Pacearchaeota archaeon]|nr:hypothetical protein [Candidatus Pacearchaeota archaeon]